MIDWNSNQTRLALKEIESYIQIYGRGSRLVRLAYGYRRFRNFVYYGLQQRWAGFWHRPQLAKDKLHVLLHLRGGLGDCASHWVAVRALRRQLPHAVFHYFTDSPQAARLFVVPDALNHILPAGQVPYRRAYDLACELCISWKTVHVNQARIEQLAPQFRPLLQTSLARQRALGFFLQDNYLLDDALGRFLYHQGAKWLEAQRYLSALDFDVNETGSLPPEILQRDITRLGLKPPYITVHSGINAAFNIGMKTPLKCWPTERWEEFLRLFKQKYPHIQIVQVGGKNSPRFANTDVCLLGETSVEELPAILAGARLHIDGESGLVQLTRWLPTKAVVLFANTAPSLFALSKNINLSAQACGHCMWLEGPSWHTDCLLGYPVCANMQAHSIDNVLEAVAKELA